MADTKWPDPPGWGDRPVTSVEWLDAPEDHDYGAAAQYLSLIDDPMLVPQIVDDLRNTETVSYYAKDILRASQLPLLPKDNEHVAKDLRKIKTGKKLSPVLLIRGYRCSREPLTIADGYHRVCAAYEVDENAVIRCRIVA